MKNKIEYSKGLELTILIKNDLKADGLFSLVFSVLISVLSSFDLF